MTSRETLFLQLFTHFLKSTKTCYSLRTLQLTCTMAILIFPPATLRKGFSSSTSSPTLDIGFLDDNHSDWDEVVSQGNLNLWWLGISGTLKISCDHFVFLFFLTVCINFISPFIIDGIIFLVFTFCNSLSILPINPLYEVWLAQLFSHRMAMRPAVGSLCWAETLHLPWSHLLVRGAGSCTIGVLFRNFCPMPVSQETLPRFSSSYFSISGFNLRPLIYFWINFCTKLKLWTRFHSLAPRYSLFPVPFIGYHSFPIYIYTSFVRN